MLPERFHCALQVWRSSRAEDSARLRLLYHLVSSKKTPLIEPDRAIACTVFSSQDNNIDCIRQPGRSQRMLLVGSNTRERMNTGVWEITNKRSRNMANGCFCSCVKGTAYAILQSHTGVRVEMRSSRSSCNLSILALDN